jgi:hypothetical protein
MAAAEPQGRSSGVSRPSASALEPGSSSAKIAKTADESD